MRRVTLRGTGITTTALGFGTASLMGKLSRSESMRLLELAYENGIRHYDTAPLYGYGESESLVGAFRKRHPDITVATKFGLGRPAGSTLLLNTVKRVARPVLRALPSAARAARTVAQTRSPIVANFDCSAATASLAASLRALRPGPIDIYLLHECRAGTLDDEPLLRLLTDARQRGDIRAFGLATDFETIRTATRIASPFAGVLQFANGPREPNLTSDPHIARDYACITHSPFGGFGHAASVADGRDPLDAAAAQNPDGVVLFSSQRADNIARNTRTFEAGRSA